MEMMKRDKFLGQDPTEKIVFVFFFERNRKKISLFVQYENDTDLEYAQQLIMIYTIFWENGSPLKDIIENFENDPNRQNSVLKLWHTMP
ncbi:hypothetical protein [uncultured Acinetobacter sp.]|uniref:hypothetical protein n=1 Tax=uncultured Acinetobacter sp. TaxID=165433 RepID=UPI002610E495|nr:hypothetical protein [uncultured Acinetobacter sp.]